MVQQFVTGQGDITNPLSWQDVTGGQVPPIEFDNVPANTNYPLNGDGRYWWTGNANQAPGPTRALLHFDGTAGSNLFPDAQGYVAWAANGGAVVSATNPKFGTGNFVNNGGGSANYITTGLTHGGKLDILSGSEQGIDTDFTIECFLINNTSAQGIIWDFGGDLPSSTTAAGFRLYCNGNAISLQPLLNAGWQTISGTIVSDGTTWHHVAVVRHLGVMTLWIDGVSAATSSNWTYPITSGYGNQVLIGASPNSSIQSTFYNGHIDEFRVSSVARYTAPFTPPVQAFGINFSNAIKFIGDPVLGVTGTAALTWSINKLAPDGSIPVIMYTTDGGATVSVVQLGSASAPQNGQVQIALAGQTGLQFAVGFNGGTPDPTAILSQVAVAITRNINESLTYDSPNPFDPSGYNAACNDNAIPSDTLANLRKRLLIRLGFPNQATNPPPGMALLCNDFIISAQTYLFRRYQELSSKRKFRWKVNPGQRFYSLKDNDEAPACGFQLDPRKPLVWAGIQDSRNVWYPFIEGIPPQLYTMIAKPWRPARYTIRQAIEVYPAPDQTYWMWFEGSYTLRPFAVDADVTTIDSEGVFLHALANAKAHYGQPDASNVEAQANAYRKELIAATHQTSHYVPGTIAVPPAVRPTLIQYQDNQGG